MELKPAEKVVLTIAYIGLAVALVLIAIKYRSYHLIILEILALAFVVLFATLYSIYLCIKERDKYNKPKQFIWKRPTTLQPKYKSIW